MSLDKQTVIDHCKNILSEKIDTLKHELIEIQESSETETKNSAGDKYETGIAMLHQQKEKLIVQIDNFNEMFFRLDSVKTHLTSDQIGFGSLVQTQAFYFFICTSIGKISIDDQIVIVLSPESPIGKSMLGKSVRDSFNFKNENLLITTIH